MRRIDSIFPRWIESEASGKSKNSINTSGCLAVTKHRNIKKKSFFQYKLSLYLTFNAVSVMQKQSNAVPKSATESHFCFAADIN